MRICHLTSVHSRADTRIMRKECISLARHGYDISLVVADGNGCEISGGALNSPVEVYDVGASGGRLNRIQHAPGRVFAKAIQLDADVYHLHDPELLPIGLKLKRIGKKVIFDVHEDYVSQIREKEYIPKLFRNLIANAFDFFEKRAIAKFDSVIVAANHQLDRYNKLNGNVHVVQNYVDPTSFSVRELDYSRIQILHAGSLTEARGLHAMITLAQKLSDIGEIYLAGPIYGDISPENVRSANYLGILDHESLVEYYNKINLGLILYRPVGQYGKATAIKLYEYMAAGVPVIVPDHGDWPRIIEQLGIGVAVNVFDVDAQIESIRWFQRNPRVANEMGRRGRDYVNNHASWKIAEAVLLKMYAAISI